MYHEFRLTPRQKFFIGDENDRTIDYSDNSGFKADRSGFIEDWTDEILDSIDTDGSIGSRQEMAEQVSESSKEIYSEGINQVLAMGNSSHNAVSTRAFNLGKANKRAYEEVSLDYGEDVELESFWVGGMHRGVQEALSENNIEVTRTGTLGSASFESAPVRAAEYLEKGFYSEE